MVKLQVIIGAFCLNFVTAIVIDLPDGKIEGIENTTRNGIKYYSFLAVPFAEPPVGPLRLQAPEPVKPWKGIFDGTVEKNICYQVYENSAKENEDCLYLNVFTPKDLRNSSIQPDLTVMVWIHGGGFISGSSYIKEGGVGPNFLIDKNVVLVSVNYRLGPLGFLSTGDEVLPGNLGLKDQVLALKWVQKNIARFGGDPKKVTIFGQSAGSAACSYLLLSPLSKGLFRAAILESGAAISPGAYQRNERNITFQLLQKINPKFKSTNSSDVLEFLQSLPAALIDNASLALSFQMESPANFQSSQGYFFAPVIEVPHEKAFLTKRMYGLFENGDYIKVPVFMGMVNEEALIILAHGDRTVTGLWQAYDSNPEYLVPFNLHITDKNVIKSIGVELREKYAGKDGFITNMVKGIKFHSMQDFDKGHIKQAELMAKHSQVYFYEFSYKGKMGNYFYDVPELENSQIPAKNFGAEVILHVESAKPTFLLSSMGSTKALLSLSFNVTQTRKEGSSVKIKTREKYSFGAPGQLDFWAIAKEIINKKQRTTILTGNYMFPPPLEYENLVLDSIHVHKHPSKILARAGNVTHAEEVNYLFSKWYSPEIPDNTDMSYFPVSDQNVHKRIMSLWTNFAKYLNPTPPGIDKDILQNVRWESVKPSKFKYLEIGENLNMKTGFPKNDSYIYWTKLYEKYAVLPLDTF